jgi:23S rRNA (uracil1939-C5)-methyltransferase
MREHESIELTIDSLAMGGEGVGRHNGMAVFVPDAVPGDKLKVILTDVRDSFARGRIGSILQPSPDRTTPSCPLASVCGGCQWQHIKYPAQLKFKTKIVTENLERIGRLSGVRVNETIGMKEPWGFRNKIQYPIGRGKNGKIVMGYFKQGTHDIVDIDNCPIEHPKLSRVANIVKETLNKMNYASYDEDKGTGLFRHLRARIGFGTGEVLLTFITNEKAIPGAKDLVKEILSKCKKENINVVGICHSLNDRMTNVIMGDRNRTMWGRDYIYDKLGDLKFKVSNESFYQTNPQMTEVLYNKALEFSGADKKDTVIDAYSGIGTIALWFAKNAEYVYGIEDNKQAVYDAADNAEANRIENCRFSIGRVEKLLPDLDEGDILVLDPPRGGCEEKVIRTMSRSKLKRVVYISCNPSTLARDLKALVAGGFRVDEVQPVDMFPHSFHIETVTKITKK